MNNQIIKEAINDFKNGFQKLEKAFSTDDANASEQVSEQSQINTELLSKRLAYCYSTFHPEYKVESQLKNLKDMINSAKISIVLNWLRKNNIEGIENLFKLDTDAQRVELNKAVENFSENIKEIFKQRFS